MKRSEKVKPRVSWQSGPNFCQVKQFRKEDPPAEVGPPPQPHNFSKQSCGKPQEPDDDPDLPPGFENYYAVKPNVSNIPQIKWKRPPKFSFNEAWLVKDGQESTETKNRSMPHHPCVGMAQEHPPPACLPSSSVPVNLVKNLRRGHGKDNHETNQNYSQTGIVNRRMNNNKVQKQCNYFGTARGCRNGDRCRFIHDRFRPNIEAEAPRDKRLKFGSYEKNSG